MLLLVLVSYVAENCAGEQGNCIHPVRVHNARGISFAAEEGCNNDNTKQYYHAGGNKLFPKTGGLQAEPDNKNTGNGEKNCTNGIGDTEKLIENIAGTGGICNHAADRVGANRYKYQNCTKLTDILFSKAGKLKGLFGTQSSFCNIQHGESGKYTCYNEPQYKNRPASKTGGIGKTKNTGTNVSANDYGDCFIQGKFSCLKSAFFNLDDTVFFFHNRSLFSFGFD